ncbi:MAG: heme ABC transporter ATP-binding protein [Phycisphaerae bacterium]
MLYIENIHAGYGPKEVVHGVTVQVREGQFLGLIGPNGSGKSTLLRVAGGVLPFSRGSVTLNGDDIRKIPKRSLARTLAVLPQNFNVDFPFTVREIVAMGRFPYIAFLGRETAHDLQIIAQAMELADVTELADRVITELSGGERQRAYIAMCLAQEPSILLLDEPTSHLDITHQISILDLIRSLNRRQGLTVMAVFHDLNLAAEYCDNLLVLNQGKMDAVGPAQDILTAPRIAKIYQTTVYIEKNHVSGKPHIVVSAGTSSFCKE